MNQPYQVMPPLSEEDFQGLEQSIKSDGVLVAIEVDEFGAIIDGHNRLAICRKLGISDYPVVVRSGLSDVEKRTLARKLNLARRHLIKRQKWQVIRDQIRDTPHHSDTKIAAVIGCARSSVGYNRRLIAKTEPDVLPKIRLGADGKRFDVSHRISSKSVEWSPITLRDGSRVDSLEWHQIAVIIRQNEEDNRFLRSLLTYAVPSRDDDHVSKVVPHRVALEKFQASRKGGAA